MQPDTEPRYAPDAGVIAAEQKAVGAAITARNLADAVTELLAPEDCYEPAHAAILAAAADLSGAGHPVDPASVLHHLTASGDAARAGNGPYLHTLAAEAAAGAEAARYHARVVTQDAERRRHVAAGQQIVQLSSDPGWSDEHREQARVTLDAASGEAGEDTLASLGDILPGWIDRLQRGASRQVRTGWRDLDKLLRIRPDQLIVVGARPGQGKSLYGVNVAAHVALRAGSPVLLASMEMGRDEVTDRIVSAVAGVSLDKLTGDEPVDEHTWNRIAGVRAELTDAPLFLDDSRLSIARLRSRLRWLTRRQQAPALVIVDYIGLMDTPPAERREQQVAALSRELKALAGEFHVPIVALSQLNRAAEARADKRPTLADLRESGALEQDANAVLLLHRPSAYNPTDRAGEVDLIVAKNRAGETGTVTLAWQPHRGRMNSLAKELTTP